MATNEATTKRRALISVSDKAGVLDFARDLAAAGWELLSTGGTLQASWPAATPPTRALIWPNWQPIPSRLSIWYASTCTPSARRWRREPILKVSSKI